VEKYAEIFMDLKLEAAGQLTLRYGLVLVLFWIGAMKFTAYEAEAIRPLVESSPVMNWLYRVFDLQTVSNLLGITEITAGLMIGLRPYSARLAALGSTITVLMFLVTLSFLFSLPGWESSLGGFPALSGTGGFLLKDVVLLGTALWSLGEALAAMRSKSSESMVHAPILDSMFERNR
jgi:uncharacterized membrane protein YkgB